MLIEVLGLFQGEVKFFFQVLQYFSRFLPQNPLFFQVFQVWTYFSRFSRFSRCGGNPDSSSKHKPFPWNKPDVEAVSKARFL